MTQPQPPSARVRGGAGAETETDGRTDGTVFAAATKLPSCPRGVGRTRGQRRFRCGARGGSPAIFFAPRRGGAGRRVGGWMRTRFFGDWDTAGAVAQARQLYRCHSHRSSPTTPRLLSTSRPYYAPYPLDVLYRRRRVFPHLLCARTLPAWILLVCDRVRFRSCSRIS